VTSTNHPALQAFVAQIGRELVLAQALIRRVEPGYELRHVADRDRAAKTLRELRLSDLRQLARFTVGGAFRPLKAAPSLAAGWWLRVKDDAALDTALNQLYPGTIADWFAAQSPSPPVTNYREFSNRQTGMYRVTRMLDDAQAAQVARACCHKNFCLKRRIWTVNGMAAEAVEEKSLIPCLEPCAVLLEFARKAMRMEQEKKLKLELSPGEAVTLAAALRRALAHPDTTLREADFNAPGNPRRIQLLLEKIQPLSAAGEVSAEE
jgi:4Fe-4S iron-sulfur cluster binding domain/DR2241 stabilising domain